MSYRGRRNVAAVRRCECINREVNIVPDVAYYINQNTGNINPNNALPIIEVLLLGNNITTSSPYSVRLNNGVYDISFSVISTSVEEGISGVTLYAEDTPTNIASAESSFAGGSSALSARGIYVSTNNSVELRLVNTSTSVQQFSFLNFVIKRIS